MTRDREPEIIAEVGGVVDETRVTLGVYGDDLDPEDISKRLECSPTRSHRRGDTTRSGIVRSHGAWLLTVEGKAPVDPDTLVSQLLMRLPAVEASAWSSLRERYTLRISFGLFVGAWNRGFDLSPVNVERLARTGAIVGFDIYADLEDEG